MKKKTAKLSLFAITWPLFIEIMLYMLMGNADTLMLSQYSDNSVAAVGVSNQILSMVIVMFGFVATGTAILVAQNLGAERDDEAREVSSVSIGANLVFGILLSAAVFIFSEQLLKLMDLPPELFDEANSYLKIVGGFSFIQSLIMTVSSIIRSYGFTRDIMYVTIGMNVLNVIGNYFFIFGPFGFPILGVEGVAISTTVSRIFGLLAAIFVMTKRIPGSLPLSMLFSFPKRHLKNLLNIGIPSAGEHLSYNGSQMVITYFIASLGTQALTAKVYTQNVMMFIFLFSIAISQGTQILIGHMVGAKEVENAYKRALKSLKLAILISIAAAVIVSFFSKNLLGIFTDNLSIIELGTILILLTIILEPGRSFNLVLISSLRAAGDVKFPVYMGILSMWGVSVTLSYFLGIYLEMGLVGIWIAFIADEWLRGLLMLWRWRSRVWVKKSFVTAE
ncbi:MATE family efflux transporter [Mesobacillus sp. AQ2]|jgi:putative MATE family efflux protein|uniref:MATE family efflux transporter n=1 Tax=Bacillaceae TaxID=186817 RepID=UPI0011AAE8C0|nr:MULTISPECIES: MATE family efflux transporter [Bacillaceae]MCM3124910.1 MATE family efflux transporter [Mesobacillus sp. MER 33]MCM3232781.1 MATE family efflux transporter [Mesobacillus sp. MER 48]WHX41870.1 MATE family efflux transporter [Mesobacillus sp. AQ2]